MESFNIAVSMLRQYCFCPRIPFFYIVRGLSPISNEWVKQGISFHNKVEMLTKRRNLSRFGLNEEFHFSHEIKLYNEKLFLHGICDGFLELKNEIIPLEFKMSDNIVFTKGASIQLCAYALLLEEQFKKEIKQGFILYGSKGKTYNVIFDNKMRKETPKLCKSR